MGKVAKQEETRLVAVGASAGGLAAFEAFLSGFASSPPSQMALVLVQHLSPDHKSLLAEILQRSTQMSVVEVEDGAIVEQNRVYVLPAGHLMSYASGRLLLHPLSQARGPRLPIDFFFASLAKELGEEAVGIVLAGTGSDGAEGVRAIMDANGYVLAQSPESTEFDSMPLSAIATGAVAHQVSPEKMAKLLLEHFFPTKEDKEKKLSIDEPKPTSSESEMAQLFALLRAGTGHDFSEYKPNTIHRRVERRMVLQKIETLTEYVEFLKQSQGEVEQLFKELLIGVTRFFRDPDAFAFLASDVIPRLFSSKEPDAPIRVWVTGCSTGEEAYSIAILLQEYMAATGTHHPVQVFATDIDGEAIATARLGVYPAGISADVSPERLARYFSWETNRSGYRIHKTVRDMLIFSEQDVVKDPPFSRLDLISCRNLLIYLGPELQKRLIPVFEYALNPGGCLFLGSSEGIGEFSGQFTLLDRKSKLFLRKSDGTPKEQVFSVRFPASTNVSGPTSADRAVSSSSRGQVPLKTLTEQLLLSHFGVAAVLVNGMGDILYIHGRTGLYLEPNEGEARVSNLLSMAREGLKRRLSKGLMQAQTNNQVVEESAIRVKTNGHHTLVDVTIRPAKTRLGKDKESALFLVLFEPASALTRSAAPTAAAVESNLAGHENDTNAQIAALRQELLAKEEFLLSAHEELQSSYEELKSSNEEMQSVNEELQSANEELETSKEELQSVNEELSTVNAELHTKVHALSLANNDMNNLLAGTGIGTVFVDHELRILRFTPPASEILNLIPTDVGRPIGHIVPNLIGYPELVADIQSVLDTLVPKDIEVEATYKKWYELRIRPYRTLENVIEGVVVTFIDTTDTVKIREALRSANKELRLAMAVRDSQDAIVVQNLTGGVIGWNPAAERLYGWPEAEALKLDLSKRVPDGLLVAEQERMVEASRVEPPAPYKSERIAKDGATVKIWVTVTALLDESGVQYGVATIERARADRR